MDVLPDILAPDLSVVFVGTAVGECSAARGHYYAGPGNAFWRLLHEAALTPVRLAPQDDTVLPEFGLGLTDVVKDVIRGDDRGATFDVTRLVTKIEHYRPDWVAFNGKKAAEEVARAEGQSMPGLGPLPWPVAGSRTFVLPSSSGANQRREYDGRPTRLEWWAELSDLLAQEG